MADMINVPKLKRLTDGLNVYTFNGVNYNWDVIEQFLLGITGVIEDRGIELLSSEGIQEALNKWLSENEFKPKEAVATFSDLPQDAELKELRGVIDENAIYVFDGTIWIKQSQINFDGLNDVKKSIEKITINVQDFATLEEAINSDIDAELLFPSGVYNINSNINGLLKGNRRWKTSGKAEINFVGTTNDTIFNIDVDGHDFVISGDFHFNGNDKAKSILRVTNQNSSDRKPIFIFKGSTVENVKMTEKTTGAKGVEVRGGFSNVLIENNSFAKISRSLGTGTPGSVGTSAVSLTYFDTTNYVKKAEVLNCKFDTVTNEEVDGTAGNVDCDAIAYINPLNDGEVVESTLLVDNCEFIDCKGRSIKSQASYSKSTRCKYIHKNIKTTTNAKDVDFQYGMGYLDDFEVTFNEIPGEIKPYGDSHAVVNCGNAGRVENAGVLIIGKGLVNINVNPSISLPYFATATSSTVNPLKMIKISDVNILGKGRIKRFLNTSLNGVNMLNISDTFINWLETSLINDKDNNSTIKISVKNVLNGTNKVGLYEGTGIPKMSSENNAGFNTDYSSVRTAFNSGENLVASKISSSDNDYGGSLILRNKLIKNGETVVFDTMGMGAGMGIYLVSTSYNERAASIFSVYGATIRELTTDAPFITFGAGSNPAVDGQLNIWSDSTGKISMKNSFGSDRHISLVCIG